MDSRLQRELEFADAAVPFRYETSHTHHTWARTFHSRPALYITPHTLPEIQKTVTLARRCRRRIVVVGSGHSPSDLTCSSSWMVNLDNFNKTLDVNEKKRTMTVEAGIRLHQLNARAKEYGLTIPNLGSIDEQSIAGALATATHGSSLHHGPLSSYVVSLRICLANGQVVKCSASQNEDLFKAALTSLGALGIIVEIEYKLAPTTNIEWVQTLKPLQHVLDTWNTTLWTQAEFTRVWWLPYMKRAIIWRAQKTSKPARPPHSNWYGGRVGFHTYHFLLWVSNFVPRILPAIEWFVFGMQYGFSLDSRIDGCEEQSSGLLMNCLYSQFVNEWGIPLSKGPEALSRLSAWINGEDASVSGIPLPSDGVWVHCPIEVRVSDCTLSPTRPFLDFGCRDEPTLYLNATLYRPYGRDPPCRDAYYAAFEYLMKDLGGRPHWAKNFQHADKSYLESVYGADLTSWRRVRDEVDPEGVFTGDWHRRTVLADTESLLPCEEVEHSRRQRRVNGVDWYGRQAINLIDEHMEGLGLWARSTGSSEESFDYMAGAEAESSVLFESGEVSEDEKAGSGRVRPSAESGVDGVKVFEKM